MVAEREALTVDFSANFLAPAVGEAFRATGIVLRGGRTRVITRGEVHALAEGREPRLIAALQATMMAVTPPTAEPGA